MRMRKKHWAAEEIAKNPYVPANPENVSGQWRGLFMNNNPIHVEIGMGKGGFIMGKAELLPTINFIGIEKQTSVFALAARKMREAQAELANVRIVLADAGDINKIFSFEEISHIYINFCDPWPKKKHEGRRLTHSSYLALYEQALAPEGMLDFKTDNYELFLFSLEELKKSGWAIKRSGKSQFSDNVASEYELKFMELGEEIFEFRAICPYKK